MKPATILAALTIAAAGSFAAQAQSSSAPPTPRPAAGALSQNTANQVQKSFRTQTPDEQRISRQTAPMDIGQVGSARNPK
jgi:hypothetical protein